MKQKIKSMIASNAMKSTLKVVGSMAIVGGVAITAGIVMIGGSAIKAGITSVDSHFADNQNELELRHCFKAVVFIESDTPNTYGVVGRVGGDSGDIYTGIYRQIVADNIEETPSGIVANTEGGDFEFKYNEYCQQPELVITSIKNEQLQGDES